MYALFMQSCWTRRLPKLVIFLTQPRVVGRVRPHHSDNCIPSVWRLTASIFVLARSRRAPRAWRISRFNSATVARAGPGKPVA